MKHSDIKNGMKVEVVRVLLGGCHPKGTIGKVCDKDISDFRVVVGDENGGNWYEADEVRRPRKAKVVSKTSTNNRSPKQRKLTRENKLQSAASGLRRTLYAIEPPLIYSARPRKESK